jgi:hypothetical protein
MNIQTVIMINHCIELKKPGIAEEEEEELKKKMQTNKISTDCTAVAEWFQSLTRQ